MGYKSLGFNTYAEYLQSDLWINRRAAYARYHPSRCIVCQTTYHCHLHHLTYDRVGQELDSDFVWLCEKHHNQIHNNGAIVVPSTDALGKLKQSWLESQATKKERKRQRKQHNKQQKKARKHKHRKPHTIVANPEDSSYANCIKRRKPAWMEKIDAERDKRGQQTNRPQGNG